jgi:hypothetical protein
MCIVVYVYNLLMLVTHVQDYTVKQSMANIAHAYCAQTLLASKLRSSIWMFRIWYTTCQTVRVCKRRSLMLLSLWKDLSIRQNKNGSTLCLLQYRRRSGTGEAESIEWFIEDQVSRCRMIWPLCYLLIPWGAWPTRTEPRNYLSRRCCTSQLTLPRCPNVHFTVHVQSVFLSILLRDKYCTVERLESVDIENFVAAESIF